MELARRPGPSVRVRVREHRLGGPDQAGAQVRAREDRLATEEPLEIRATWPGRAAHRVAVTMRTPGHDFELAVGLLHAEGMVRPGTLAQVAYCTDADLSPEQEFNVVTVRLSGPPTREAGARSETVTSAASACGVCGAQSIDDVLELASLRAVAGGTAPVVPAEILRSLPDRLRSRQRVFDATGGLHAAGMFTGTGDLLVLREDIGRHNAVDKVVGARLMAGEPTGVPVLCVSGRIGFEIVQKAVAAGVGMIAAIGAPSSLSVRLAEESGLALIGFLSERRFVVYSGADRVQD